MICTDLNTMKKKNPAALTVTLEHFDAENMLTVWTLMLWVSSSSFLVLIQIFDALLLPALQGPQALLEVRWLTYRPQLFPLLVLVELEVFFFFFCAGVLLDVGFSSDIYPDRRQSHSCIDFLWWCHHLSFPVHKSLILLSKPHTECMTRTDDWPTFKVDVEVKLFCTQKSQQIF